jgi:hypothetical protein
MKPDRKKGKEIKVKTEACLLTKTWRKVILLVDILDPIRCGNILRSGPLQSALISRHSVP